MPYDLNSIRSDNQRVVMVKQIDRQLKLDYKRQFQLQMQVDTDFSHPLKFNCSSIASSTPGNNVSFPDGQMIKFQEFNNESDKYHPNPGHKKKLTIEINDSYDFNESSMAQSQVAVGIESTTTQNNQGNINFFKKHQKKHQGLSYCIGESQSPSFCNSNSQIDINKILSFNSFLQQKLKNLENENLNLKASLNNEKSQIKILKTENESLKITIKKKEQALLHQKDRCNKLNQKIAHFQQQKAQQIFYDEKLLQKESKIQQLQRKLQKMTIMNKAYQKQLKQSDKKIMQLEKETQKNFCQNQQETISRIKESSIKVKESQVKSKQQIANKQNQNANLITNNMGNMMGSTIQMRKSIDKKKCSQSQGKKSKPAKPAQPTIRGQRVSSSSNILAKKLLTLKKQ